MARLQLPEEIFPRVLAPGTVLGKVTATAASQTGLAEGTVVGSGTHEVLLAGNATYQEIVDSQLRGEVEVA